MENKRPRVLIVDIETTPNLGYTWGIYEQNVLHVVKETEILCFVAKWLDSEKIIFVKKNKNNDRNVAEALWKLLDQADIVIAHNGDNFDIKKINARLLKYHLLPPSPYKTVDTKKVLKRYFSLNSNSLNDAGKFLSLGEKVKHSGFSLWLGCMANDPKAWTDMYNYNVQDVLLLQDIYIQLRPWITNHPNYNSFTSLSVCPKCGCTKSVNKGTIYIGKILRQRRRCVDCGGNFKVPIDGKDKPTLNE